jgi:hypothetical protein
VKAILEENIQGIDEQICGLRTLARGLLQLQIEARSSAEAARLSEAYLQAAGRQAELIKAEPEHAPGKQVSDFANRVANSIVEVNRSLGYYETVEDVIQDALQNSDPGVGEASRQLEEEIASMRYVLRNIFQLAMEAQDAEEYVRLVGVYGEACMKLLKLLKTKGNDSDRVDMYFRNILDDAMKQAREEMGIQ